MSILLDACVPAKFKNILIGWGYSTSLINEHIQADAPDTDVIVLAQQLDAVLLTVDMDFANVLNYPPQDYQGIVVMRYKTADEVAVINTLRQALQDLYRDNLRGVLVIVQSDCYRIRQGNTRSLNEDSIEDS